MSKIPRGVGRKGGGQGKAPDVSEDSWVVGCRVVHIISSGHGGYRR